MKCTIIGITGGTGSGKSTFTNRLKNEFPDDVAVIYHDNYYRCQDAIPFEARKKGNYDHPDSLETDLLTEHLKKLKAGESIVFPANAPHALTAAERFKMLLTMIKEPATV